MKNFEKIRISYIYGVFILILIIVAVAICISMKHSSEAIRNLQENTERYIDVQEAIGDMKEGTDYLTEHCRAYIVSGDRKDCMLYFDEVNNARRRDLAIETLHKFREGRAITEELENSLKMSNELMDIEMYAMKLASEGKHRHTSISTPRQMSMMPATPRAVSGEAGCCLL